MQETAQAMRFKSAIILTKTKEVRINDNIMVLKNIYFNDFVWEEEWARKGDMR